MEQRPNRESDLEPGGATIPLSNILLEWTYFGWTKINNVLQFTRFNRIWGVTIIHSTWMIAAYSVAAESFLQISETQFSEGETLFICIRQEIYIYAAWRVTAKNNNNDNNDTKADFCNNDTKADTNKRGEDWSAHSGMPKTDFEIQNFWGNRILKMPNS